MCYDFAVSVKLGDCGCPGCHFVKKIFKAITLFAFYLCFLFVFFCREIELREIPVQKKGSNYMGLFCWWLAEC